MGWCWSGLGSVIHPIAHPSRSIQRRTCGLDPQSGGVREGGVAIRHPVLEAGHRVELQTHARRDLGDRKDPQRAAPVGGQGAGQPFGIVGVAVPVGVVPGILVGGGKSLGGRPGGELRERSDPQVVARGEGGAAEVDKIIANGITPEELSKCKNQIENEFISQNQRVLGIVENLANYHVYFGDANLINKELDRYMKVTAAEMQAVAKKYFVKTNRLVLYYLPDSSKN